MLPIPHNGRKPNIVFESGSFHTCSLGSRSVEPTRQDTIYRSKELSLIIWMPVVANKLHMIPLTYVSGVMALQSNNLKTYG